MTEEERNLKEDIIVLKTKIDALETALEAQKMFGCLADANKIGGTTVVCTKTLRNLVNHYKELGQAKGIIKEFVSWATWEGANCPNFKDIQSKAEQFLKQE